MTLADWIQIAATMGTIVLSVVALGKYLVKSATSHAVDAAQVANALDRLNETAIKLTKAIEHMDGRLNKHEIDIALLKQREVDRLHGEQG